MPQEAQKTNQTESLNGVSVIMHWLSLWPSAVKRFIKNSGFVHASSLSYTTLVGLIPVLAVGLSVATSLMFKDGEEGRAEVEVWIDTMVKTVAPMLDLELRDEIDGSAEQVGHMASVEPDDKMEKGFRTDEVWEHSTTPQSISKILNISQTGQNGRRREVARQIAEFVSRIHTRTIGMTSVILFLVVAILLLRAIERTFNKVWEIPRNRSWGAGVAQYWAGLTLMPFLFIIGTGLSSSSFLQDFTLYISGMRWFGKFLLFIFSWMITGSACALVYRIMTNTRVTLKAAVAGGLSAGLLLQLNSQLSVVYFSNVATVNKIYGSLGAIPILLLGLYVSWIILIFGSHVAYLVQFPAREFEKDKMDSDEPKLQVLDAIKLLCFVGGRFSKGEKASSLDEIADQMNLELTYLSNLVRVLKEGGLLFLGAEPEQLVSLAKPSDKITLAQVFQKIDTEKVPSEAGAEHPDACNQAYSKIIHSRNQSAAEITISDLIESDGDHDSAHVA